MAKNADGPFEECEVAEAIVEAIENWVDPEIDMSTILRSAVQGGVSNELFVVTTRDGAVYVVSVERRGA